MLSNRAIVLASAAVLVALVLVLALGPRAEEPRASSGDLSVQPSSGQPVEVPRVVSVPELLAGMTATERECFTQAVGSESFEALGQGSVSITDGQLESLGSCLNPGLPNPAGVVQ